MLVKSKVNYYPQGEWELAVDEVYEAIETGDQFLIGDSYYPKSFFEVVK